jgi:hypothetical protein
VGKPEVPNCYLEDDEVETEEWDYSVRAPGDWVISGPLPSGSGPGRRFENWDEAEEWARAFYGKRLKSPVWDLQRSGCHRWGFLIRGPRG